MGRNLYILAALSLAVSASSAQGGARTGAPGYVGLSGQDGLWSLVSPEGKPFISRGVDVVKDVDDSAKPGERGYYGLAKGRTREAWAIETAGLLKSWNFDTVGCWSADAMRGRGLYTVDILYVRIEKKGKLVDVFERVFSGEAEEAAKRVCAARRDDRELLGYFLENEQPWYGDYGWYTGHVSTVLDSYMSMPEDSAGKKALVSYYRGAYGDIAKLNLAYGSAFPSWEEFAKAAAFPAPSRAQDADREAFVGVVARRYYSTLAAAIRAQDPNHLVLGDRFANYAPREVVRACGEFCDVVSLNYYLGYKEVSPEYLKGFFALSGRPLLITEFSYRADDNRSGNRNTRGVDVTVKDQGERAEGYARYTRSLAKIPFVVGYHWFQFFDEPPGGRYFDGEDGNLGIVDIYGKPYEALAQAMLEANAVTPRIHAASGAERIGDPVFLDVAVKVKRGPAKAAPPRPLIGKYPQAYPWADEAALGSISLSTEDGFLSASYESGSGWGCGFSVLAGAGAGESPVDLSAFQGIELRIFGPPGLRLCAFLCEDGAENPGDNGYKGARGSDGESYSSGIFALTEGETKIRVPFDLLSFRSSYGNQAGNRSVDLMAIETIEIHVPGGQGKGKLVLGGCVAY